MGRHGREPGRDRLRDYYALIDGTTTRGFELEAAGAINERWNVSFGYTYAYSEDDDGNQVNTDTPRNTLKAATDYRIPGILQDRLTVGGAVRWQSATDSIQWDGNLPNIEQDAYAVFDVNASYDVTEQAVLTLSVNNVLDEKYYASTGFYNTVIYGDGIGAELMLRLRRRPPPARARRASLPREPACGILPAAELFPAGVPVRSRPLSLRGSHRWMPRRSRGSSGRRHGTSIPRAPRWPPRRAGPG